MEYPDHELIIARRKLFLRFYAAVAPRATATCDRIMRQGLTRSEQRVVLAEQAKHMRQSGVPDDRIPALIEEMCVVISGPVNQSGMDEHDRQELYAGFLGEATDQVLSFWIDEIRGRMGVGGLAFIATLDESLLPPYAHRERHRFLVRCFADTGFPAAQVRDMLRTVRLSLPSGEWFPKEALPLIGLSRVASYEA